MEVLKGLCGPCVLCHMGTGARLGDAAVVRVGGVEVVLNAYRTQALGDVFTPLGIDWRSKKIVVVKSSQHFHAAYAPSAHDVLYVETPGSMTMDWRSLPYRKRRAELWPFARGERRQCTIVIAIFR